MAIPNRDQLRAHGVPVLSGHSTLCPCLLCQQGGSITLDLYKRLEKELTVAGNQLTAVGDVHNARRIEDARMAIHRLLWEGISTPYYRNVRNYQIPDMNI